MAQQINKNQIQAQEAWTAPTSPGDVRALIGNNAFVYLDGVTFKAEA